MPKGVRHGGRAKGTPNKRDSELAQRCKELGVDLWTLLMQIANDPSHPRQFDAIKEGLTYIRAKKRSVEDESEEKDGITIEIVDYSSKPVIEAKKE